jgi:hypothetical protein
VPGKHKVLNFDPSTEEKNKENKKWQGIGNLAQWWDTLIASTRLQGLTPADKKKKKSHKVREKSK